MAAGSGDKIDDDDDDDEGDDYGTPIDEDIKEEGEIDIDPPISRTPQFNVPDNNNNNDNDDGDTDDDDDSTIDVDGEDWNVGAGGTGRTSTGGNDGDIITERGRQWFLFLSLYFLTCYSMIFSIYRFIFLCSFVFYCCLCLPHLCKSLCCPYCTCFICVFKSEKCFEKKRKLLF